MPSIPGLLLIVLFCTLAMLARRSGKFSELAFTFVLLATGTAAFAFPATFTAWGDFDLKQTITPFVQLILFGMGMTLTLTDFRRVLEMPRAVFVGMVLQYAVMPLGGLLCAWAFGLAPEIALGFILLGSCPGGVASNVFVYIAKANVPLSVTMTAVSTLLSPLMTPLAMKLLAGTAVPVPFWPMVGSILEMIVLPLAAGILILRYLPRLATWLTKVVPLLAMLGICIIIAVTIAVSRDDLADVGGVLLGAAACHNGIALLLGFYGARLAGLNTRDARTVSIEVGIQNGGMATGLAFNVLGSAKAALASAAFGPWSAFTSSALASWWRRSAQPEAVPAPTLNAVSLLSHDTSLPD